MHMKRVRRLAEGRSEAAYWEAKSETTRRWYRGH